MAKLVLIVSIVVALLALAYGLVTGDRMTSVEIFFACFIIAVASIVGLVVRTPRDQYPAGMAVPFKVGIVGAGLSIIGMVLSDLVMPRIGNILMTVGGIAFFAAVVQLVLRLRER